MPPSYHEAVLGVGVRLLRRHAADTLAKLAAALEKDSRDKPIAELEVSLGELKRTLQATAGYVAAQVPA